MILVIILLAALAISGPIVAIVWFHYSAFWEQPCSLPSSCSCSFRGASPPSSPSSSPSWPSPATSPGSSGLARRSPHLILHPLHPLTTGDHHEDPTRHHGAGPRAGPLRTAQADEAVCTNKTCKGANLKAVKHSITRAKDALLDPDNARLISAKLWADGSARRSASATRSGATSWASGSSPTVRSKSCWARLPSPAPSGGRAWVRPSIPHQQEITILGLFLDIATGGASWVIRKSVLKKVDNHAHAVALHVLFYNFCRIHKTLRVTGE